VSSRSFTLDYITTILRILRPKKSQIELKKSFWTFQSQKDIKKQKKKTKNKKKGFERQKW
jgi:hypothetical protein